MERESQAKKQKNKIAQEQSPVWSKETQNEKKKDRRYNANWDYKGEQQQTPQLTR